MHEGHFTEQIVDSILAELSLRPEGRPTRVRVKVGESYHLVSESVLAHFEALTRGTRLEGTALELEEVPMQVYCPACSRESLAEDHHMPLCRHCGASQVEVLSGQDVTVEMIELENAG